MAFSLLGLILPSAGQKTFPQKSTVVREQREGMFRCEWATDKDPLSKLQFPSRRKGKLQQSHVLPFLTRYRFDFKRAWRGLVAKAMRWWRQWRAAFNECAHGEAKASLSTWELLDVTAFHTVLFSLWAAIEAVEEKMNTEVFRVVRSIGWVYVIINDFYCLR